MHRQPGATNRQLLQISKMTPAARDRIVPACAAASTAMPRNRGGLKYYVGDPATVETTESRKDIIPDNV